MKFGLPALFFFIAFLQSDDSSAQLQQEDSNFYQTALAKTLAVYYHQLGDQSQIFNGIIYSGYDHSFQKGSPYFLSDKPLPGSVVYDKVSYPDLMLSFDQFNQVVVMEDQAYRLKLINERISSFEIAGFSFILKYADSANRGIPSKGFYEILYDGGPSQLLKRTTKEQRESLVASVGVLYYMDEFDNYYIRHKNTYFPVNTKSQLLEVMGDHKKEVQRFIRKNKLNYRTDKDNTLKQVAAYYDQLASH
jgi:hypothetical protein